MAGGNGGFGGKSKRDHDGDFHEADVWVPVAVKEREGSNIPRVRKSMEYHFTSSGSSSSAWLFPAAPRVIPRAKSEPKIKMSSHYQLSAPVNVPDWSKIYKKNIGGGGGEDDQEDDDHVYSVGGTHKKFFDDDDDDDDDVDEDEMVPPHEFIARRLAKTKICSYSMFEGIGRTLKGRDLSKLRNAILAKTGFLD